MSKVELKELNLQMGIKEYNMYQDIPAKENGSTNLCYGLPFELFSNFLESQMARKYNKISYFDTPTISYIIYSNNNPVGYICLRTKINKNWKSWCGNIFYAIRLSERKKGFATQALSELIKIAKTFGLKTLYAKPSENNIASEKVITNNKFIKTNKDRIYKLKLD